MLITVKFRNYIEKRILTINLIITIAAVLLFVTFPKKFDYELKAYTELEFGGENLKLY